MSLIIFEFSKEVMLGGFNRLFVNDVDDTSLYPYIRIQKNLHPMLKYVKVLYIIKKEICISAGEVRNSIPL